MGLRVGLLDGPVVGAFEGCSEGVCVVGVCVRGGGPGAFGARVARRVGVSVSLFRFVQPYFVGVRVGLLVRTPHPKLFVGLFVVGLL